MLLVVVIASICIIIGVTVASVTNPDLPAYNGLTGKANATCYGVFNNVFCAFSFDTVWPIMIFTGVIFVILIIAMKTLGMSGAMSE
jgi:hypothetical protein